MKNFKEKFYNFAVSDFDGTLFRTDRTISEFSINVINDFIKRGGTFCICTGRMTSSILNYCKNFNLGGYLISYNGAEIIRVETGEKIYKNHVDNQACIKLLEYAEQKNLTVQVYPNDKLLVERANERIHKYSEIVKVPITESHTRVSSIFKCEGLTSAKVLFYTDDNTAEQTINEIRAILGADYNVNRSNEFHIDVVKSSVNKGKSVLKLAQILNLDTNKLICFGDERNDVSLLSVAGLAVACENANKSLKEVAHYVTASCDDDGVAKALIKFGI